ncbi:MULTISPECIES: hypothetical protein [unclassified Pseudomonas]|uniref:hypothetical protein n=1 Tax=unclassified Pseudomonas TaxID=196821 RepID=UPI0014820EBD|nr:MULTISPECIES: hypothetical protein [unclassified Pseudomonas]
MRLWSETARDAFQPGVHRNDAPRPATAQGQPLAFAPGNLRNSIPEHAKAPDSGAFSFCRNNFVSREENLARALQ